MYKYLIFFITSIITIYIIEIFMLGYLLFDFNNKYDNWLNSHNDLWLFIVITVILIAFHIFWLYSFFSTWMRYKNFLKINDSVNAISLCSMIFTIIGIIFLLIFNPIFEFSTIEIIILIIIIFNIIIMSIFNFFILFNYHNFNQRFIKNILDNTKNNMSL